MNTKKILEIYHHEKDERIMIYQRKSLLKRYVITLVLSLFLMFFSWQFQDIPTVYYTIYILFIPMIFIIYGTRAYFTKSKMDLLTCVLWLLIYLLNFHRYIIILLGG